MFSPVLFVSRGGTSRDLPSAKLPHNMRLNGSDHAETRPEGERSKIGEYGSWWTNTATTKQRFRGTVGAVAVAAWSFYYFHMIYIIRTCKFEYYKGPKNIWFDGWVMLDSSTFSGPAKKGYFAELRRSRVDEGVSATFAQAQLFKSKAGIRKHSFLGVLQRTLTLFNQPSTPQAT